VTYIGQFYFIWGVFRQPACKGHAMSQVSVTSDRKCPRWIPGYHMWYLMRQCNTGRGFYPRLYIPWWHTQGNFILSEMFFGNLHTRAMPCARCRWLLTASAHDGSLAIACDIWWDSVTLGGVFLHVSIYLGDIDRAILFYLRCFSATCMQGPFHVPDVGDFWPQVPTMDPWLSHVIFDETV